MQSTLLSRVITRAGCFAHPCARSSIGRSDGCAPRAEAEQMVDDRPSELLLTYAELGDRFGINADAARFRAKRAKWPIVTGNDGRVRVRITPEQLPERPPERTPDAR